MKWIIGLLIILIIYMKLNYPKIKGMIGEKRVSRVLKKLPDSYKLLNDVMIGNFNTSSQITTSQIDHIVISKYGLFVIETKTYTGWIHGSEKSEYWTQSIYRRKRKFQNPIRQNWGHICALKEILKGYNNNIFIPIIVFAGDAELKNINAKTDVIHNFELYGTIMKYSEPKLSEEDVDNIYNIILENTDNDRFSRRQHVRDIKTTITEKKMKEKALVCPRCSGQLIIRSGKYGKFYGCSNYPTCKYKKAN